MFLKLLNKYKYELIVLAFFMISRLPSMGHDMFNTDEWKWKSRSYDFGTGVFSLDFERTIQKYHPGVTLMWAGSLGVKVYNFYHDRFGTGYSLDSVRAIFELNFVQVLLVTIITAITILFIFYVLCQLFGAKYALLTTFLLCLEPFYVALTRTFHLEGMMSTFMLASILWFYYWYEDHTNKKRFYRLVCASFFAALAFLTKTSSLYLIPFFGLYILIRSFDKKHLLATLKTTTIIFLKWFVITFAFVFLIWPALWVNPAKVGQVLYKGIFVVGIDLEHAQYYFNKYVEDPGPTFYFVVLALRSSIYLFVGFICSLVFYKKYTNKKISKFILYLAIYIFFYFLELTIPSKKLDRYILPAMTALILWSGFFYVWVLDKVKLKNLIKYFLFFITPVLTAALIHPDYLSFYNPLFGGLRTGIFVLEPKWMIGQREIISYFKNVQQENKFTYAGEDASFEELVKNHTVDSVLTVGFPEKYYTQIWPFFREMGAWAVIKDMTPFAVHTKYFIYPVWEDSSNQENRFAIRYVGTIKIRGVDVYKVYERY